ncbi:SIS domain-containing protein [Salinithrix halophila]|uniref:UPF0309 protein ACFOUO_06120 n=1 Tax=Salinithrix halophila TaxID=1485204 RepID=A0ABV8JD39_9BACL
MLHRYFQEIRKRLDNLEQEQATSMKKAAAECVRCIQEGGILHLFGSGHSHLLSEEGYYRAGGLAPVRPIVAEDLLLSRGGSRCSFFERKEGYAASFLTSQDIRPGEVLFVFSTSGRNPVPVDVALFGREKGAFVIGVTALAYSRIQPSRHSSGLRLWDCVDLAIDNGTAAGDSLLSTEQIPVSFGPGSTVLAAALLNGILAETVRLLAENGMEPPIFKSGNLEGADSHNQALMERYGDRIPF